MLEAHQDELLDLAEDDNDDDEDDGDMEDDDDDEDSTEEEGEEGEEEEEEGDENIGMDDGAAVNQLDLTGGEREAIERVRYPQRFFDAVIEFQILNHCPSGLPAIG